MAGWESRCMGNYPTYKRDQKGSKGINRDQKGSKGIKRDQKGSKGINRVFRLKLGLLMGIPCYRARITTVKYPLIPGTAPPSTYPFPLILNTSSETLRNVVMTTYFWRVIGDGPGLGVYHMNLIFGRASQWESGVVRFSVKPIYVGNVP